jgi:hypothetical protein
LTDESYAAAAARLGARIRSLNGLQRAADHVEDALRVG